MTTLIETLDGYMKKTRWADVIENINPNHRKAIINDNNMVEIVTVTKPYDIKLSATDCPLDGKAFTLNNPKGPDFRSVTAPLVENKIYRIQFSYEQMKKASYSLQHFKHIVGSSLSYHVSKIVDNMAAKPGEYTFGTSYLKLATPPTRNSDTYFMDVSNLDGTSLEGLELRLYSSYAKAPKEVEEYYKSLTQIFK